MTRYWYALEEHLGPGLRSTIWRFRDMAIREQFTAGRRHRRFLYARGLRSLRLGNWIRDEVADGDYTHVQEGES